MLVHPQFDPIAVQVGPLAVHWYGLMYLIGFTLFYLLGLYRCRQEWRGITKANLEDLLFVGMVGVIVGGRLGFVLLYQPEYYLAGRNECARRVYRRHPCALLFCVEKQEIYSYRR